MHLAQSNQPTRQTLKCRSFTLKWFYIINSCHLNEYKCAFKCYWMRFYRFQIHWMICWSSVCLRYFNNKTIGLFLLFLKIPTIPNVAVQNFKLLIVPIVSVRIVCFDKSKSRTILHFIHFLRLLKVWTLIVMSTRSMSFSCKYESVIWHGKSTQNPALIVLLLDLKWIENNRIGIAVQIYSLFLIGAPWYRDILREKKNNEMESDKCNGNQLLWITI